MSVQCSLCSKDTDEWCEQLACRACHKSLSFDACVAESARRQEEIFRQVDESRPRREATLVSGPAEVEVKS